jgi:hypothetical protein
MQNATLLSKLCGLLAAPLKYGDTDIVAAIKCCSLLIENGSSIRRIYRVAFESPSDEDYVGFWCDPEDGCIVIPETRRRCRSE